MRCKTCAHKPARSRSRGSLHELTHTLISCKLAFRCVTASQVFGRQRHLRGAADIALRIDRAEETVRTCPPARARAIRVRSHARAWVRVPCSRASGLARRRHLGGNAISGALLASLSELTALQDLCAHARPPALWRSERVRTCACVHAFRRRDLASANSDGNHISGTLLASLSALTALTSLCAHARLPALACSE